MSSSPKIRSDSRLKTLPESVQAEIVQALRTSSREATKAMLLEKHNVQTNVASLSEFLQWWQSQKRLEEAASLATQISKVLAENPAIKLDADQITKAGQVIFESIAVANQDPELWIAANRERNRSERTRIASERNQLTVASLKLEREKFEFKAAAAAIKEAEFIKAVGNDKGLSDDEKLLKVRTKLFGQLPEVTSEKGVVS